MSGTTDAPSSTNAPAGTPTGPPADLDRAQRDQARLARGGALNLAGSVVNAVATFVLTIIVTRNLGPGGTGAFLLATALFQVVTTAGQLGADTGLGRFIPRSIANRRPEQIWTWTRLALVPVAVVGVVSGLLIFVFVEPLADLVASGTGRDEFVTYVRVLAPFTAIGALYFALQTGSRAFGTMRPSVLIERLARPLAQPVAMVAVFALGLGPAAVAWAWIGPYAAAAFALAYWYVHQVHRAERRAATTTATDRSGTVGAPEGVDPASGPERDADRATHPEIDTDPATNPHVDSHPTNRPEHDTSPATNPHVDSHPTNRPEHDTSPATNPDVDTQPASGPEVVADARTFWRFSGPRAVASLFQVAVRWLDVLLVGALADTRDAGIYGATSRWLVGGTFVVFAINQAFQPQISAMLARAQSARARALFQSATSWAIAIVWPLYLTLAVFGPVLVRVFGRGFDEGADALIILAVGGMIGAACGPVDMVLLMGGRSSATLLSAAIGLVLNIGVNIALVPHLGFVGAAIAWSVSLAGTNLIGVWQIRHLIGRAGYGSTWARAMVAAVLGVGLPLLAVRLLLGATPLGLVVGLGAGGLVYGMILWRWRDIVPVEILLAARKGRRGRVA